jgi:hypothetical protein
MRTRERSFHGTVAAAVVAAAALACAGASGERTAAAPSAHPEVDTGIETCASCHAQATPEVARAHSQGRHGLALVECVVCHGSTGADFRARPGVASCGSCHPSEAASVARAGPAQTCFSCHPPHSLAPQGKKSPHGGRP